MDALDEEARNQLIYEEEVPFSKIKEQVPIRAKAIFEKNYLQRLKTVKHKPCGVVELRGMSIVTLFMILATHLAIRHSDMDKKGANCDKLIMSTAEALFMHETLELFCLSILRNDVESCIKDVINQ
jgi:hypothetical protein